MRSEIDDVKEKYSLLKSKYYDRTPVIVDSDDIKQKKLLVPIEFTFGELLFFLRKKMKVKPSEATYIYVKENNSVFIPITNEFVSKYEHNDFVYICIKKENTFGSI